jgi:hypothetical protein
MVQLISPESYPAALQALNLQNKQSPAKAGLDKVDKLSYIRMERLLQPHAY